MPEATAGVLNDEKSLVVNAIEQEFWETGRIPSNERLCQLTSVEPKKVAKFYKDADFRQALILRGIDLKPEQGAGILTSKQLLIANMMLNIYDKRSDREKFEQVGITPQQFNAWKRDPVFQGYMARRAEQLFASSDPDAFKALVESVKGGDTQSIKLYMEMRGKYTPRAQLDINVEQVLVTVVEVIAKHVKDPTVIRNIAADLQLLDSPVQSEVVRELAI